MEKSVHFVGSSYIVYHDAQFRKHKKNEWIFKK